MKIHDIPQGHKDWFQLRIGKVTASEAKNLLTPNFERRKGQTPQTYVFTKVAEAYRGKPLIHLGSWATEQGQVRQDLAIPWLSVELNRKIREGGFIETDDGKAGCSPDGLVGDDLGVEVKCCEPVHHVKMLFDGALPAEYVVQVYFSMFVTGFGRWIFCAYHEDFPKLILEIRRDEAIMDKIAAALESYQAEFDRAMARVKSFESYSPFRDAA